MTAPHQPTAEIVAAAVTPPDGETAVHRRSIDLQLFDQGGSLLLRGRLQDSRPWQDDPAVAVVHDMHIEFEISLGSLTITRATAQMAAFPHAECPLVTAQFGRLVGVNIARGYNKSLREAFGGVTGCAHVYELARAAGSAVVQGNMSRTARRGKFGVVSPSAVFGALKGMCHIWSEGGVGPRKLDAGWRPGREDSVYPAPALEEFQRTGGDVPGPS